MGNCSDCDKVIKTFTKDFYMVKDHIWEKYGVKDKWLCLDCFEERLGRKIELKDFSAAVCNVKDNPVFKDLLIKNFKELKIL